MDKTMNIFHEIYAENILTVLIVMPILLLVWSLIGAAFHTHMRIIGVIVSVLAIGVILYKTVFSRSGSVLEIDLIPFSSFERAKIQPEMYRSMLMNVFFFMPLGLSLAFVFGGDVAKRLLLTLLTGFIISVTVETVQYFCSLGFAETDDVICNTLGTTIGFCAYPISLVWRKVVERIKST